MKKALVFGSTGNFGSTTVKALLESGWRVSVFKRPQSKLNVNDSRIEVIEGDITHTKDISIACEGVDLIVYGINPPYTQWRRNAYQLLDRIVSVVEQKKLHILFPGNVYCLPTSNAAIDETTPLSSQTKKGDIRLAMEQRLKQAAKKGARVTIIRAGDFIGGQDQWFNMTFKPTKRGWKMVSPHDRQHQHFWSYLPDLSANAIRAAEGQRTSFEVFHDVGVVATIDDWKKAFKANDIELTAGRFPWWAITCTSLVVPLFKEVSEMRYLWRSTLILDGTKLKKTLADNYHSTPLHKIVGDTLSHQQKFMDSLSVVDH
ncbi:NAD(P)H-binding protein [Vibrio sp. qd031]|uniref:NAD(P)H-binding protein n=1 Tax=Vibrio sp. qd031 TaxID=1603038 RepID=UPI001556B22C|nr:NAD(P)H-binding protein [Vibrio sp. qd031]